jgi:hypothetical protein
VKVRIAFATDADGNPDVARIGSVEEHPDADAKNLIKQGIAAAATEQDIADWESTQAHRKQVADAEAETDNTAAVEQPQAPRKQRRNRVSGQLEDVEYAAGGVITEAGSAGDDRVPAALGSHPPIVTVAPGAESSPDVDPADRDK